MVACRLAQRRSALRVSQFHNYKGQHLASLILFKGPFVYIEEAVAKVNGGKSQFKSLQRFPVGAVKKINLLLWKLLYYELKQYF